MTGSGDYSVRAGGDITGSAFGQGGSARVNYQVGVGASGDTQELQRRLGELDDLLTRYAAALPDVQQLRDLAGELGTQLQSGRPPNRTVVRSLLTSLTAGAGGVNAVLAAVNGIGQLVSRLLN